MQHSPNYIAFLCGINTGKRQVQTSKLKVAFERIGLASVVTVLATGNVAFYSEQSDSAELTKNVEAGLSVFLGFPVQIILRKKEEIEVMYKKNPFISIRVNDQTRLYVTFLSEPHNSTLQIPYVSPDREFQVLEVSTGEVFSVLVLSQETRTIEAMSVIQREFGENTTTRNWNTVVKAREVMGV